MSASRAGGVALNATVATEENAPGRTRAQQEYLDTVADEADRAVDTVQNMINDLRDSLGDRKTVAEQARAEAENGRV